MTHTTKHTPGPWRTYNMSKNKILKQWHIQRDDCKHDIALVSLDVAADERESVANLIAAAPELLEALKQFVDYYESMQGHKDNSVIRNGKAAINKAEGRDK